MTLPSLTSALIPFHVERSGHITVEATIRGQALRFLLDTGAGATCFNASEVEAAGLALTKRTTKGGGVGDSGMALTTVGRHDLQLGGLDLSSLKLHALDLSHVNAGLQAARVKPVSGVFGADLFRKWQALLDYGRNQLVLGAPVPSTSASPGKARRAG